MQQPITERAQGYLNYGRALEPDSHLHETTGQYLARHMQSPVARMQPQHSSLLYLLLLLLIR